MPDVRPRLLIVDDEPAIVSVLEQFAQAQGFDVFSGADGPEALAQLPSLKPDAALVDLHMPGMGGIEVLRAIGEADPNCRVILMTARPQVDSAIEAVKLGALDYLSKPFDFPRLAEALTTVRAGLARRQRLFAADSELGTSFEFHGIRGRSPAMQELFDSIRRLAPHVRMALITGETGTGKELVARALHKIGRRPRAPLLVVNCSAIVESLFESTLFGHIRGAFTGATENKVGVFEAASGGTVFLDEIGELPRAMQAKLLRTLEYGEIQRVGTADVRKIDVCVVAATNVDLPAHVQRGRFRRDLYYRLNVVELMLPPLRDRREDIPYLAAAFIAECSRRFDKPLIGMSAAAERELQRAEWPGNVRELRNVIERACMAASGRMLGERDIIAALGRPALPARPARIPAESARPDVPEAKAPIQVTREQVVRVLEQVGGNRSAAARELKLSRRALYRRLDTLGLR